MYKQILLLMVLMFIPMVSAEFATPANLINDQGLMYGLALWAYEITNGWFWTAMLLTFCVVLFIASSRYTTERAFGYAGVVGLLGSLILITLNLMDWKVGTIFIGSGILGIVWLIVSKDSA